MQKKETTFLQKIEFRVVQRNAQRVDFEKIMLKNASSLAIVGLDTAENGPSKVRQVTNRIDAIIGCGSRTSASRCPSSPRSTGPRLSHFLGRQMRLGFRARVVLAEFRKQAALTPENGLGQHFRRIGLCSCALLLLRGV